MNSTKVKFVYKNLAGIPAVIPSWSAPVDS